MPAQNSGPEVTGRELRERDDELDVEEGEAAQPQHVDIDLYGGAAQDALDEAAFDA